MGISPVEVGYSGSGLPSDQTFGDQKLVIRYKGPFDWTYLARTVHRWFEQRRFRFYEKRVKDTGKRMKVDWEATRDIDEFVSETYTIKVEMWHVTSHEVIVNGEPRRVLNGMVQLTIKDKSKLDRAKFFKKGSLMAKLFMEAKWREFETNVIDVHQYRAQEIMTMLQECLKMTTRKKAPW